MKYLMYHTIRVNTFQKSSFSSFSFSPSYNTITSCSTGCNPNDFCIAICISFVSFFTIS